MRPAGSSQKGKLYERDIARLIRQAFDLKDRQVYRTPMSGGHPYASTVDPGDIQFAPDIRDRFPWHVECKHHADVKISLLFRPEGSRQKFDAWLEQVTSGPGHLTPILVFRADRKNWAALPAAKYHGVLRQPTLFFYRQGRKWVLVTLDDFLLAHERTL